MSTPQTNKTAGSHIQDPAVTLWGSGCTCRTHPGARPPTAGGAVCVRRRCGRNRLEHHSVDPQLTCLVGLAHKTYHEAPRCQVTRCTTKSQLPPNLAGQNSSDRQAQKHDEPIWPLHRRRKTVLARFTHGVNYVYSPDDQRFIHALGPGHGRPQPSSVSARAHSLTGAHRASARSSFASVRPTRVRSTVSMTCEPGSTPTGSRRLPRRRWHDDLRRSLPRWPL